ncbi:MAG: GAF domain-containing protein [Nakamurella sp.]
MADDDLVAASTWLELLAAECSPSDIERFRRARIAADPHADANVVDREAAQALRILGALEERKQHADQLAVLNHLARRLASLRDPGVVLQEIAQQARRLLAVDLAYIMLLHEDGRLVIEVVDGSMGSSLRGIVLRPGSGLGGEVIRSGAPVRSENYLSDAGFPHLSDVDSAAVNEQLGGILGVPLLVGEETIGVLLAAERQPRRFTSRDVELLAALASHAAVAIRNAELFEQTQASAAGLLQANITLQHTNQLRQQADDLRARLTDEIIHGGGLLEVAAQIERLVGVPVAVYDLEGSLVAGDPGGWPAHWVGELPRHPGPVEIPSGSATAVPVILRSGYAGVLLAAAESPLDEELQRLLAIGATAVALVVASEQAVAEAALRNRGEFINALLSPESDEASVVRRAAGLRLRLDDVRAVVVLDPGRHDVRAARRLGARLADGEGDVVAEHADHVVALLTTTDPATVRQTLQRVHPDPLPCAIGIASCEGGVQQVRTAHQVARQTATVLIGLGRDQECAASDELGVYRALFSQAGRQEISAFVDATVGALLRHDRERGRDLARTLAVYLEHSRHHGRTCAALHIHANTLYQRLDRITELLGPEWSDPGRGLEVQLALRMHELFLSLSPHR